MENNNTFGVLTISKRAIASLVAGIAISCSGIIRLTDRSRRDEMSRILHGNDTIKGVYIEKNGLLCTAHIYAVCRSRCNVPETERIISSKAEKAFDGTDIKITVCIHKTCTGLDS